MGRTDGGEKTNARLGSLGGTSDCSTLKSPGGVAWAMASGASGASSLLVVDPGGGDEGM